MLDPFNREIHYLRISVTDRCNLRCIYCMPEQGIALKNHRDILAYEQILEVARAAVDLGIDKVRLTGGEPLVRKGINHLIEQIKSIPGIKELSLTTNGVMLGKMAGELKRAGLDRLNISLDTLNPEKYRQITRIGNIADVLSGIDAALAAGFKGTKLNMVVIPGCNDDEVPAMQVFCQKKGLLLQRINHYSLENPHSIPRDYTAERPLSCTRCNRIRLTADGKLKPCLFSDLEYEIDFDDLKASLKNAILNKPRQGTFCKNKQNWQIGG